jgi:hypothetical protein
VVSGSFDLAGKTIPLPEGKFALAAAAVTQPAMLDGSIDTPRAKLARVVLVQTRPPRLRAAVVASAVLDPGTHRITWGNDLCKKEDALFRADAGGDNANCLLIDHQLGTFSPQSRRGVFKEAANWLATQQVELPVGVLISATLTRTENWQLISASYAFNPRLYGCASPRSLSWAQSPWHKSKLAEDPQRVRFVESVTAFGKVAQTHFDELVAGRPSTVSLPAIYSCASAQASLH